MGTIYIAIIDLIKDYNCCSEVRGYYHISDQTEDCTVVVRKFVGTIIDLIKPKTIQLLLGSSWVLS